MAKKTFGRVCFDAYIAKRNEEVKAQAPVCWDDLNDHMREAWEAGANAVHVAVSDMIQKDQNGELEVPEGAIRAGGSFFLAGGPDDSDP